MIRNFLVVLLFSACILDSLAQITPPYFNEFDSEGDDAGWSHYSTIGTDDWLWGVPTNGAFNAAYSQPWAWYNSVGTNAATVSARYLETPEFDLSGLTDTMALTFWNKRDYIANTNFWVEYTIDGGLNWLNLENTSEKKTNWSFNQDANLFVRSSISLDFLMGEPSVRFRFELGSGVNNFLGWIIDNFSIDEEHYDLQAINGDTLEVFSTCDLWEVDLQFSFINQYLQQTFSTTGFYLSYDNVLDETDQLIHTDEMGLISNYGNAFYPLTPVELPAGNYYIIYELDLYDEIVEDNEENNIAMIPLVLNPVYFPGYIDDFEDEVQLFEVKPDGDDTIILWEHGMGYDFRTASAHSGSKAWHVSKEVEGNGEFGFLENSMCQEIHSPTFDFSDQPETLCLGFWFKLERSNSATVAGVEIATLNGCQAEDSTPFVAFPAEHHEGWRFFTRDIGGSELSLGYLVSYKFRAKYLGDYDYEDYGMAIDDFYIGEIKPDLVIEGDKLSGFVNESATDCELHYEIVNCGLIDAGLSTTTFYYSVDSLYDAGDILLGQNIEESVSASTRTMRTFSYAKPNNTDNYFIIYQLDVLDEIDEMREYDNMGFIRIFQHQILPTPYYNDFEVEIDEWSHWSSLNEDEWNWNVVDGPVFDQAFSVVKAWLLGDSGQVHTWRLNHLYSPVFDLTNLEEPVLGFQMYFGYDNGFPSQANDRGIALEYSVNGGTSWDALSALDGEAFGGSKLDDYGILSLQTYHMKGTQNATQYYFDLGMAQGVSEIQFRFTAGVSNNDVNADTLITEGFMIDNFGLSEGNPDFVLQHRELMLSELYDEVVFNTTLYNNGNQAADSCWVNHFLSIDDVLDEADFYLGSHVYTSIEADVVERSNHLYEAPGPLSDYNYLILQLDPDNLVEEQDETNNTDPWPLTDLVETFPYVEDFNDPMLRGWNFEVYQYDNLVVSTQYLSNIVSESTDGVNEEDFLTSDYQSTVVPSFTAEAGTPEFYLYSPPFNFEPYDSIQVSFELKMEAQEEEGVNFAYSLNNGNTWPLFSTEDALIDEGMTNWYSEDSNVDGSPLSGSIEWLDDQAGWTFYTDSLLVSGNASFLRESNNVLFRIRGQVSHDYNGNGEQGWSIDDFLVETFVADYCAADSMVNLELSNELQDEFTNTIHAQNVGETNGRPSKTCYYWSADDVLDINTDELAVCYNESNFIPIDNFITNDIPMPLTLAPGTGYLFYVLDSDDDLNEINEENNVGSFMIGIPSLINYIADVPQTLFADHNIPTIVTNYEIENPGTLDGGITSTKYYWSEDNVLDAGDEQFAIVEQSNVPHLTVVDVMHTLEYPIPIEQQDYYLFYDLDESTLLDETDETDNNGVIHVDFYTWQPDGVQDEEGNLVRVYFDDGIFHLINVSYGPVHWELYNNLGQMLTEGNVVIGSPKSVIIPEADFSKNVLYMRIKGANVYEVIPVITLH